jgi:putative NADH-flavin reductase
VKECVCARAALSGEYVCSDYSEEHDMARIAVLGGTGYGGAAVVSEAARRGHTVTSYSRSEPTEPVDGVRYVTGSVLDESTLADAVHDVDVVFVSLSPRSDMEGKVEGVVDRLITLADGAGVRLGVLGGVSSVLVEPGGQRVYEAHPPAAEIKSEVDTGLALLAALQDAPASLDWFYVSPPLEFGAWAPVPETGSYRLSDDVLLTAPDGSSRIGAADLALAVVDEIEQHAHPRRRFHVGL